MGAAIATVALLMTVPCGGERDLPEWPADVAVQEAVEDCAAERGPEAASELLEQSREYEQGLALASDVIVLGAITSVECFRGDLRPGTFAEIEVAVEECPKGQCGAVLTMYLSGGGGICEDGFVVIAEPPFHIGPLGEGLPLVGSRYLLLIKRDRADRTFLRGGSPGMRYEVGDGGVVFRKDLPLAELFVAALRAHLESRTPVCLFRASDAVVLGTVAHTDKAGRSRDDPDSTPQNPGRVVLDVEEVAKTPLPLGETIDIRWPSFTEAGVDVPRFTRGQRVVLFLRQTDGELWALADGWDSSLPVRENRSFAGYASLRDLAEASQDSIGVAPLSRTVQVFRSCRFGTPLPLVVDRRQLAQSGVTTVRIVEALDDRRQPSAPPAES